MESSCGVSPTPWCVVVARSRHLERDSRSHGTRRSVPPIVLDDAPGGNCAVLGLGGAIFVCRIHALYPSVRSGEPHPLNDIGGAGGGNLGPRLGSPLRRRHNHPSSAPKHRRSKNPPQCLNKLDRLAKRESRICPESACIDRTPSLNLRNISSDPPTSALQRCLPEADTASVVGLPPSASRCRPAKTAPPSKYRSRSLKHIDIHAANISSLKNPNDQVTRIDQAEAVTRTQALTLGG